MKKLLLLLFLFTYLSSISQTFQRVEVRGNIKVPGGSDAEGINVFNKNANRGSVSSESGNFAISVRAGDSLYFSAVQFENLLVVVNEKVVESGILNVEILEGVNELAEVVLRPHNLSGNLEADLENIEVVAMNPSAAGPMIINDYDWEFRPDAQTAVTNSAMGKSGSGVPDLGFNVILLAEKVIRFILPEKSDRGQQVAQKNLGQIAVERQIRARYDNAFFEEVLKIPSKEIANFLTFTWNNGFYDGLLEIKREMDLIEFFVEKSKEFKHAKAGESG